MEQLLRHHGDVDAAPGLLDFAVNVRGSRPPAWLRARLAAALDGLGSYPSAAQDAAARAAVAARHGRDPAEVLVLGGVAEGFALLPALAPRSAAVVHPSFTEPEVALRRAGVPVRRVPTDIDYRLQPERVSGDADLVVLGNPTNPTSVLHPAEVVRALAQPGRVLVVDEAFGVGGCLHLGQKGVRRQILQDGPALGTVVQVLPNGSRGRLVQPAEAERG